MWLVLFYDMAIHCIALLILRHKLFGGCRGSDTPPQVGNFKMRCRGRQLCQGFVKEIDASATRVRAEEGRGANSCNEKSLVDLWPSTRTGSQVSQNMAAGMSSQRTGLNAE